MPLFRPAKPGGGVHNLPFPAQFYIKHTAPIRARPQPAERFARQKRRPRFGIQRGKTGQNQMQAGPAFQDDNLPVAPESPGKNGAARAGADHPGSDCGGETDAARWPGFTALTVSNANRPIHRLGARGCLSRRHSLWGDNRGRCARLARFLPRPGLRFLACPRGLARLFAFQRRQHIRQVIGAGERFLCPLRFGPLRGPCFTFAQPGFSDFLIQSCCGLAEFRRGRRPHHGVCRRNARAAFGLGIGQAQLLSLGADLPRHALQYQKPAQSLIRWGGLCQ